MEAYICSRREGKRKINEREMSCIRFKEYIYFFHGLTNLEDQNFYIYT